VISDTHGNASKLEDVILQQPKADCFLHLGDGEWDVDEAKTEFPDRNFLDVAGNCDFASSLPIENELVICGKRIFYTHGHRYYVKSGNSRIISEAIKRRADILLFGHTHRAFTSYEDGLYILNPGSLGHPDNGRPTYGIVDITPAGIFTSIVEV
jgi:putative phosphoesterase